MVKQVTKEDIDKLRSITTAEQESVANLGSIVYQIDILENKKKELISNTKQLQQMKTSEMNKLTDKYGHGELSLDTGEFTSTK